MRRIASVLAAVAGAAALASAGGGCSVGSALSQPPYINFNQFQLGEPRMRVADLIGAPRSSTQQPPDNHLVDYHEFRSGTPGETRLRVIGYIVGDVFSFGLAEFIFWPLELTVAKARDFRGFFAYDSAGNVSGYRIVNNDGTVERQDGVVVR